AGFTTASPPSGSKRPRHRNCAPKEGGSVFQAGLYGGYTVLAVKTADTRQPALKVFRVITQPLPGNVLRRLALHDRHHQLTFLSGGKRQVLQQTVHVRATFGVVR